MKCVGHSIAVFLFGFSALTVAVKGDSSSNALFPPFIITNLAVEEHGNDYVTFSSDAKAGDKGHILCDVKLKKKPWFGDPIYSAKKAKQADIDESLIGNPHVLLHVHGFRTKPTSAMKSCHDYNTKRPNRKFLAIPIIWDTTHSNLLRYGDDRTQLAPQAGAAFKDMIEQTLFETRQTKAKWSIMCHSMGNYVLRIVGQLAHVDAQGAPLPPRQAVFENIFMVAPDVREDFFDKQANDYIPSTTLPLASSTQRRARVGFNLGKQNLGLNVVSLCKNKVHVLWNKHDLALLGRQTQKAVRGTNEDGETVTTKALGRHGDRGDKIHPELKDRVQFHNVDKKVSRFSLAHNYQWEDWAVDKYEEHSN